MNVILFQTAIVWEQAESNFELIEKRLDELKPEANSLLVMPEMFSTGFSFELETVGEDTNGASAEFLKRMAQKFSICTVASFPHQPKDGGKGLNRLLAYFPDGSPAVSYDKIHPFSYGKEADHYCGGKRLPLFEFQGWTICPTICYDLRFPELYRRATLQGGAQMFLCIANWPTPRREHWNTLLRARAIENQAVMVAVNRVGKDPLNSYSGDSAIIDARGRDILNMGDRDSAEAGNVDLDDLLSWRKKFPALADATEDFEILKP